METLRALLGPNSELQNQAIQLFNSPWVPLTLELWDLSLQALIESNTAWNHWNNELSATTSILRSLEEVCVRVTVRAAVARTWTICILFTFFNLTHLSLLTAWQIKWERAGGKAREGNIE